jgi:hypothetical protein
MTNNKKQGSQYLAYRRLDAKNSIDQSTDKNGKE